ncbi:MAG: response regulator, partial [Planctomycetales bacterium]|nr:response regulator [Planctomycetales bacterium]
AIKFTEQGEVFVDVELLSHLPDDVTLEVSVRDTGIGIPEDRCHAIFEEFEQADTSVTRRFGGTGLGLAISSRLVELMGGTISVESEIGEGSKFSFTMHLRPAPEGTEAKAANGIVYVGGSKVLVVDDNTTNRKILQEMLSNWGMVPILADSGESALRMLREAAQNNEPCKLIVSDVHMPNMSGYDFIEQVRQDSSVAATPIVILTSGGREGEESLRDRLDISERLLKPVKQSELFDAIVRTLGVTSPEDSDDFDYDHPMDDVLDNLNVLLAEDNAINQKLAVGVLSRFGHRVTVANNGAEAVEAIENAAFDVILMDVQMPIMDGFAATKAIREKEKDTGKHIPIIAMTAHAMKGDREKCIDAGMDEYVAKPIRIGVLKEKLCAVLHPSFQSAGSDSEDDCEAMNANESNPTPQSVRQESDKNQATNTGDDEFDLSTLRSMVAGNDELLCELLTMYLDESATLLKQIESGIETKDGETVRRAGHTLGGASRSVGAKQVSEIAQKFHDVENDGPFDQAKEWLNQSTAAVSRVAVAINAYLAG